MEILKLKKKNLPPWKSYFLKDVDMEKILVFNNISFGVKNYKYFIAYLCNDYKVNPLKTGVCGGVVLPPPPLWFSINESSRERVKPWFFVTFNIIISHNFPWNSSICPEDIKIFPISVSYFHQFFRFSNISLLQRN